MTSAAPSTSRFFVAFLPPSAFQEQVKDIQQYFAERYQSRAAQKSPPHITLQSHLSAYLAEELAIIDPASQERSFTPHITVAFRDLTRQNFKAAWPEFQFRPLQFEFTAADLTLLIHNEQRWNVNRHFPLTIESMNN